MNYTTFDRLVRICLAAQSVDEEWEQVTQTIVVGNGFVTTRLEFEKNTNKCLKKVAFV